jgi:hypothetical protein
MEYFGMRKLSAKISNLDRRPEKILASHFI